MTLRFTSCLTASLFVTGALADCPSPTIPPVSPNRGQVHTQVFDVATGNLMTYRAARTFMSGAKMLVVFEMDRTCPPQGCAPDPVPQQQDCTSFSAGPKAFYDWDISHNGVTIPTASIDLAIKQPSGTIVLTQNAGSGVTDVETEVQDNSTGLGMKLVSMRVYGKLHPGGGSNDDFYTLWGVDSTKPQFNIPRPTGAVKRVVGSPWYDLYWAILDGRRNHTLSEAVTTDATGTLQLIQGE